MKITLVAAMCCLSLNSFSTEKWNCESHENSTHEVLIELTSQSGIRETHPGETKMALDIDGARVFESTTQNSQISDEDEGNEGELMALIGESSSGRLMAFIERAGSGMSAVYFPITEGVNSFETIIMINPIELENTELEGLLEIEATCKLQPVQ